MNKTKKIKLQNDIFLVNTDYCPDFEPNMFDSYYWANKNLIFGTAKGRGITYFVGNKCRYVLRHYNRGGFIANISKDRFIYQGKKSARSLQEYLMLEYLRDLGFNVPIPIAARTHKIGVFAEYDILISYIENSRDLVAVMKERELNDLELDQISDIISKLSINNVYHSDLNLHNLLVDDQAQMWVIDFDKSEKVQRGKVEKMLERLGRSFKKECKISKLNGQELHCDSTVMTRIKALVMDKLNKVKK